MDYRRFRVAGATYFFTVVTFERHPLFADADNVALLRQALVTVKTRHPFSIDALVLLPDHLHCLWTLPEGDDDFSSRWMSIKREFTRHCPSAYQAPVCAARRRKREQAVWQRRFWEHWIRDDDDFQRHCDYIHYNPVKHGYAATPAAWPHSTFQRFVERGIYPPDWGAPVGNDPPPPRSNPPGKTST